jgi:uncharacterized phage-associated protein
MLSCFDVAEYFLMKVDEEEGEVITHLKLQKLAYYAQSASLAFYDSALFSETLEAWKHGPVVPELYDTYKEHKGSPLPKVVFAEKNVYSAVERRLMDDVYTFFGQYAAWKLRDMTHEETPWQEAFPTKGVIAHTSMQSYFRTHWADDMRAAVSDPDDLLREMRDMHWEPTAGMLEAARRYKQGRVAGDKYITEVV